MGAFNETLRSWQNFYFMMGGAAATMAGLMFVALSLGMHLVSDTTREIIKTFVRLSISLFISVLLIAAVMLIPDSTPPDLAVLLFLGGVLGLGVTIRYIRQLLHGAGRHQHFDVWEWLLQVVVPPLSYALILLVVFCFAVNETHTAFTGLWFAIISLLLCAISNTWAMVVWILDQRKK